MSLLNSRAAILNTQTSRIFSQEKNDSETFVSFLILTENGRCTAEAEQYRLNKRKGRLVSEAEQVCLVRIFPSNLLHDN
jgi:hypothetical protein